MRVPGVGSDQVRRLFPSNKRGLRKPVESPKRRAAQVAQGKKFLLAACAFRRWRPCMMFTLQRTTVLNSIGMVVCINSRCSRLVQAGARPLFAFKVRHASGQLYSTSDKKRGGLFWNKSAAPTFLINETTAPAADDGVRRRFNATP